MAPPIQAHGSAMDLLLLLSSIWNLRWLANSRVVETYPFHVLKLFRGSSYLTPNCSFHLRLTTSTHFRFLPPFLLSDLHNDLPKNIDLTVHSFRASSAFQLGARVVMACSSKYGTFTPLFHFRVDSHIHPSTISHVIFDPE